MNKINEYLDYLQEDNIFGISSFTVGIIVGALSTIYKFYLSKSARVCSKLPFPEKYDCMKKYSKDKTIGTALQLCNKTKDPQTCKREVLSRIRKTE